MCLFGLAVPSMEGYCGHSRFTLPVPCPLSGVLQTQWHLFSLTRSSIGGIADSTAHLFQSCVLYEGYCRFSSTFLHCRVFYIILKTVSYLKINIKKDYSFSSIIHFKIFNTKKLMTIYHQFFCMTPTGFEPVLPP